MTDIKSPSLLIVDDSEEILRVTKALLGKLDINVDLVNSGAEAVKAVEDKSYFLILMDVQMPEMDGFEAVSKIREYDNYKNTPIIFLTGAYKEEFESKSYEEGAVDYILKPFKSSILISKINIFLKMFTQQKIIEEYANQLDEKVYARTQELLSTKNEAVIASLAKSNFLASMSHELRTPMHGILSYAQLGMERISKSDDDKTNKYFTNINSSAERLMGLLNNLLDLSKLESGKVKVNFKKTSLLDVVVNCIIEQQARLDELGIRVVCNPACSAKLVDVDIARISQVVTNLLSNAIKFTCKGQTIDINITEVKFDDLDKDMAEQKNIYNKDIATVLFSIRDHGKGIAEGEEEIIFDNFVQGSDTVIGTVKGTGLGLPICKEIIGLHNGKIWSKNHIDGGAIFNFSIPVEHVEILKRRVGG